MKKMILLIALSILGIASIHAQSEFTKKKADLISELSKGVLSSLRSTTPGLPAISPDSIVQFTYPDHIPIYKNSFEYDENGNQILGITSAPSFWNSGEWDYEFKEISEYDSEGNLIKFEEYTWEQDRWNLSSTKIYEYKDGVLIAYTKTAPELNEPLKTIVSTGYDINTGRMATQIFLDATGQGTYQETLRYDYSYDNAGHLTEQLYSLWDPEKECFILDEKDVYTYDENGKPIRYENYWGQNKNGEWIKSIKNTAFYGSNKEISSSDMYYADEETNEWFNEPSEYLIFYYPNNMTGMKSIKPSSEIKIRAYGETIQIKSETELASVSIYNISGQLILNQKARGNDMVLQAPAGNGIYFIKAKDIQGKSGTTKVVIH